MCVSPGRRRLSRRDHPPLKEASALDLRGEEGGADQQRMAAADCLLNSAERAAGIKRFGKGQQLECQR